MIMVLLSLVKKLFLLLQEAKEIRIQVSMNGQNKTSLICL